MNNQEKTDNSTFKSIKNNKLLRNLFNQGSKKLVQWKPQNTAEEIKTNCRNKTGELACPDSNLL